MAGKITRRSLLLGVGSLALTQLVSACQFWQRPPQFLVEFLASSIPAPLLKKFQSAIQSRAKLKPLPIPQLAEGILLMSPPEVSTNPLSKLPLIGIGARSPQSPVIPDVVSLGDSWLQRAIQNGQIEPLQFAEDSAWHTLPSTFRSLVMRDAQGLPEAQGKIWGAPYRWGHLMIAYREDQLPKGSKDITDWQDLWQEELKGRISLLDSDRVVLGLVLKSLGQSINTSALETVSQLQDRLTALNRQVKFYSSDSYLQPLLLKDTWVAVGWSTDILPLVRRDRRINAIVPESGTILTADVWVKPVKAASSDENNNGTQDAQSTPVTRAEASTEGNSLTDTLVDEWIQFFWESSIATQLALLSPGASPVLLSDSLKQDLPLALTNDPLLIPSDDIMEKSEFLEPLQEGAIALYRDYWKTMRQS